MPSFLNLVFEFRRREDPHTRTLFFSEICLGKNIPRRPLPWLNRSGFRIQHCFNLIGVEKEINDANNPWRIRQTAAYHSFDVVEGRSIWIFLKGNELLRERVAMETERYSKAQTGVKYPSNIQGRFLSDLRSHMLVFRWSLENWTHYIEHIENRLVRFRTVASYTDVTKATNDGNIAQELVKKGNFQSIFSRQRTAETWASRSPTTRASQLLEKLFGIFATPSSNSNINTCTPKEGAPIVNSNTNPANATPPSDTYIVDLDDEFSFLKLQSHHRTVGQIQQATNIMGQNRRVLGEISEHFHKFLGSANFTTSVNLSDFGEVISDFFGNVETLRRRFEGFETRLRSLHQEVVRDAGLVSGNGSLEIVHYPGVLHAVFTL